MPRLKPPTGTVSRKDAVNALLREKVITSASMLEKLKGIERVTIEGRVHGFYPEQQILNIINQRRDKEHLRPLTSIYDEEHKIVCRRATPADMAGVYAVAKKLFGNTTDAEDRKALVRAVPEGNLVVTDRDRIVSYAHIQPLLPEPLQWFLTGKIRGKHIITDYLDPFAPGKVVNVLIKSIGTYHEDPDTSIRYSKTLFIGMRRELTQWGEKGYIINRIYATSETQSGIEAANEFCMTSLGKIRGSDRNKKRFAYMIDPLTSTNPFFRDYQAALEVWRIEHPEEYKQAWQIWQGRQVA